MSKERNMRILSSAILILLLLLAKSSGLAQQSGREIYQTQFERSTLRWNTQKNVLAISGNPSIALIEMTNENSDIMLAERPLIMEWSPDGQLLASTRVSYHLEVRDWQANELLHDVDIFMRTDRELYALEPTSLAWSPDGEQIAVSSDYELSIYDLNTEELTTIPHDELDFLIRWLAWHPTDSRIAFFDGDFALAIFDTETMSIMETHEFEPFRKPVIRHFDPIVAWHPDGESIAVVDDGRNQVLVYDDELQNVLGAFGPHATEVSTLTWSPDGSQMATGDATGAIYVWDASTFQLLMTIDEYDTGITSLSWGSENSLAAASEDGVVRIWDIP